MTSPLFLELRLFHKTIPRVYLYYTLTMDLADNQSIDRAELEIDPSSAHRSINWICYTHTDRSIVALTIDTCSLRSLCIVLTTSWHNGVMTGQVR